MFSLDLPELIKLKGALFVENKILLWENISDENMNNRIPLAPRSMQIQSKTDISILCTNGEAIINIDFRKHVIRQGCLCIILAGNIFEPLYTSDDFRGVLAAFDRSFSSSLSFTTLDIMSVFQTLRNRHLFTLADSEMSEIMNLYISMGRVIKVREKPYRLNILKSYMSIIYYTITPVINNRQVEPVQSRLSRQEEIFIRFLSAVEENYKQARSIKFYADILCLTPKYLSSVVFVASKRPAGEWIDDYVMLEAKALLRSEKYSIQQVSDMLNFPNQSFFGKFFKRHAGVSPKDYRRSVSEASSEVLK